MRILYLMHVNWYWIKQRPHIFAELLSGKTELHLLHFCMFRKGHRSPERAPTFPEKSLLRVPDRLLRLSIAFGWANRILISAQVRQAARSLKPSIVWVTHPSFYPAVAKLPNCRIVYDCMDDHSAFAPETDGYLIALENALLARADLTIFSSQTLADRIAARRQPNNCIVINNGVSEALVSRLKGLSEQQPVRVEGKVRRMGYFGTISHWFDWPLVFALLEKFPDLHLELAGPVEVNWPAHERVHYRGIFASTELSKFVEDCDFLIMPFVVTELIKLSIR